MARSTLAYVALLGGLTGCEPAGETPTELPSPADDKPLAFGSRTPTAGTVGAWIVLNERTGGPGFRLGHVAGGSDLDDDGVADMVFGAARVGVAFQRGPVTTTTPSGTYGYATGEEGLLGSILLAAGDLDGDGDDEFVAGDPVYTSRTDRVGRVTLFRGGVGSDWTSRVTTVDGNVGLGSALAAGSFNGGPRMLLMGSPSATAGGRVVALDCSASLPPCQQTHVFSGSEPTFGAAVALGDLDSVDGNEVWVGVPGANGGRGAVYGFRPGLDSTVPYWEVTRPDAGRMGAAIALGDLNGDGMDELIVGSPEAGANGEGEVRIFFGTNTRLDYPTALVLTGEPGDELGSAIVADDDIDGDGMDDVLVGAPGHDGDDGAIWLLSGASALPARNGYGTPEVRVYAPGFGGARFGTSVDFVGDQNRDGVRDLAAGGPTHGDDEGIVLTLAGLLRDADDDTDPDRTDCAPEDPAIHRGATEICDAADVDEDCDGFADDADGQGAEGKLVWYPDNDRDGQGDATVAGSAPMCSAPGAPMVSNHDDCDDTDADVYTGAPEVCDGKDNDCDEVIDNYATDAFLTYDDVDRDGFGTPGTNRYSCDGTPEAGRSATADDCDDANASVHPGATEYCGDALDSDCDGDAEANCTEFDAWSNYCGCASGGSGAQGVGVAATGLAMMIARRRRTREQPE